jgi:ATP-dependent RNA helicase DDX51/DBP6
LLAQSFQNWLAQVLTAVRPPPSLVASNSSLHPEWVSHNGDVPYHDAVAPAWAPRGVPTSLDNEPRTPSCQKLLFSATLTSDPGKLKALDLHEPRYFIVRARNDESDEGNVALESLAMEKFSMPENLSV